MSNNSLQRQCVESVCRPHMKHGECFHCGRWTDDRQMRIEEDTLKRTYYPMCGRCRLWAHKLYPEDADRQKELRKLRTKQSWVKVTDPLMPERISGGIMPEQNDGKARQTIRVFLESDFDVAMAQDSDAATLNSAIGTLGLADEIYVEIRRGQPILRKVSA